MDEPLFPFAHLVAVPAAYRVLIDRLRLIGHHKILAHAEHTAESLACGTGSVGIVEVEHQVARLAEFNAVGHEPLGEPVFVCAVGSPYLDDGFVMAFEVCGL